MTEHEAYRLPLRDYAAAVVKGLHDEQGAEMHEEFDSVSASVKAFETHLLVCQECCDQLEREINLQHVLSEHPNIVRSVLQQYENSSSVPRVSRLQPLREGLLRGWRAGPRRLSFVRAWAAAATIATVALLVVVASSHHRSEQAFAEAEVLPYVAPFAVRGDGDPAKLVVSSEAREVLIVVTPPEAFPREERVTVDVVDPRGVILAHTEIHPTDMRGSSVFLNVTLRDTFLPGKYMLRFQGRGGGGPSERYEIPFVITKEE